MLYSGESVLIGTVSQVIEVSDQSVAYVKLTADAFNVDGNKFNSQTITLTDLNDHVYYQLYGTGKTMPIRSNQSAQSRQTPATAARREFSRSRQAARRLVTRTLSARRRFQLGMWN